VRIAKVASVILALHLIVLGFFFYKPPVNYFVVICFSTVIVWLVVFSFSSRKRRDGIIAGLLLQLAIQQVAYHAWVSDQAGVWWPLAQFLSLQYVVALRLAAR
jgi:hypothetical protein